LTASDGREVRHFALPRGPVRLGSAEDNDLVLPFPGVSRHHALLEPLPEGLLLRDLDSKNGLYHQGRRMREVRLFVGSEVRLGEASLRLESVSTSEAQAALVLDGPSSDLGLGPNAQSGTGEMSERLVAGSPEAVIGFVRWLEAARNRRSTPPRRELLERARRVLGSASLLVIEAGRTPGSAAILEMVGRTPDPSVLDTWAENGNAPALAVSVETGDAANELVLLSTAEESTPAPWKRDFLEFVVEALSGDSAAAFSRDPPAQENSDLDLPPEMILGPSRASRALLADLALVAGSEQDALLQGETGTGKELLARAIHASGSRAAGPFVALNCAALPAELLEADLFGILPRVATGVDARPGVFSHADGGTLLLDEIAEMPLPLQAKLLRVLQEREVTPVGGSRPQRVSLRVLSSTNCDLGHLAEEGSFRTDLYYRLRPLEVRLPPLRDRLDDLPDLLTAFVAGASANGGKKIRGISQKALALLMAHHWPGNFRELKQEVERAVLLCSGGGILESRHFDRVLAAVSRKKNGRRDETTDPEPTLEPTPQGKAPTRPTTTAPPALADRVADLEQLAILNALEEAQGNKSRAARLLGISRSTLYAKLKSFRID